MPWTETTRERYERSAARYSSDVTDGEWTVVAPLLPPPNPLGRPRQVDLRAVWDAIQYIAAAGCAWSLLPKDFPPVSTVRYYFYRWRDNGLLTEVNRALVAMARQREGRNRQPTAGVIDSQSVKTTENTSLSGYDAGKRIKGRKRHIMTDTCGHLIALRVHPANIQDRDGAPGVFARLRREAPKLRHVFADGGCAGPKLRDALIGIGRWTIQIVKRSDTAEGFEVLPRRWVVERTFAWLGKCRRLAKDWEKTIESAEAWVLIAHIRRMTRRLARA
ncbi:MAG: IS5 family transposase [Shimia sp.]|nr:IS5 family transposase [Shimia sp.]